MKISIVMETLKRILVSPALIVIVFSCEDLVSVPAPATQLVTQYVFEDDITALAAITSVYIELSDGRTFADGNTKSITLFNALYADELTSFQSPNLGAPQVEFYFNNVSAENEIVSSTWNSCYRIIYECNRILEGLDEAVNISPTLKKQLLGEAKVIRAFCHFYLVNLFGDVPLITTSDYRANATISRTASSQVHEQIIADLLEAKELLSDNYPSAGRVRVNQGTAIALLARAYLYKGNFVNAETEATEIINKTSLYKLPADLNTVFLKTSEEAIWQLLPNGGENLGNALSFTNEADLFILAAPPSSWALRNDLYQTFEAGDLRRINWIDSLVSASGFTTWYYPHKYKETYANSTGSEYSMVLRLAEQYLIRAEARAQQGKLVGENSAQSDINIIRNRAGLSNTTAISRDELLASVEQERRMELFTEWGHRFFDLKRTARADAVLDPLKPTWETTDALLPLPQAELLLNQNLRPQNPGY